jgi:hypothetical protein
MIYASTPLTHPPADVIKTITRMMLTQIVSKAKPSFQVLNVRMQTLWTTEAFVALEQAILFRIHTKMCVV